MRRRVSPLVGLILVVLTAACVDRISFDVDKAENFPVVVEGFITDEAGPYEVEVSKGFDLESQATVREPVAVKKIEIFDNVGNSEQLEEIEAGTYQTKADGIRGVVGRAYKLRVELFDGRIYESIADTMRSTGVVTKLEHDLVQTSAAGAKPEYAFDIYFDSNADQNKEFLFLWKLVMTYQISTNPEEHLKSKVTSTCPDPQKCFEPDPLICSGWVFNYNTNQLEYIFPCECCQCWLELRNDFPVVSDGQFVQNGVFRHIKAGQLPITARTMEHKTHVEVQQFSLSPQAYEFWKAIRAQKEATTSLFQPLSGKINGNFVQVEGETGILEGIFYASSVSKNSIYLSSEDIPNKTIVPARLDSIYRGSCLDIKGTTTRKPSFWR